MAAQALNRQAQVGIWIISALLIVGIIGLLFFLRRLPTPAFQENDDPQPAIEACIRRIIQENIDIMLPQGGFIAPVNYKTYLKTNVTYVCDNIGYFDPCVQQHPFLLQEMETELHNHSLKRVDACFLDMKEGLEYKGAKVDLGSMQLNISILPKYLRIGLKREMRIEDHEQTTVITDFGTELASPAYSLARLAMDIAGQEAKYCYFEYLGYMALHPDFDISKNVLSDETRIYTLRDIPSGKSMNIAVRGCVIPPGI